VEREKMNIREVTEKDIVIIEKIYAKAFAQHEEVMRYYKGFHEYVIFCKKQAYAYVVENDSEVCGVILAYEKPDIFEGKNVYIELLAILPEHQSKGYGKALIEKIENVAAGKGIKELSLRTACYMDAFHIYHHLGFMDTRDDQRYMVRRIGKEIN
jgi:ribosomal protein S18 acetylase RimI-like enzyme